MLCRTAGCTLTASRYPKIEFRRTMSHGIPRCDAHIDAAANRLIRAGYRVVITPLADHPRYGSVTA